MWWTKSLDNASAVALQCLTECAMLLSTSDLILILSHPLALVPPSFWRLASLTGSEPVESRLGLTRCLCLSHRELWNTETHWLHLTLGIRLPCSAWYNRAIHSAFCTSMLTFIAALTATKKKKRKRMPIVLTLWTFAEIVISRHFHVYR